MPEVLPTVATVVLLLQLPPAVASVKAIAAPWHTDDGPLIPIGVPLTVTTMLAEQLPNR
jgi:hypothetical protein